MLEVENDGKSKTLKKKEVINQYNDRNRGLKVFDHCMVMLYAHFNMNYHSFIYICSFATLLFLYSHYRYQRTCHFIAPNTSAKRWGFGVRSFYTWHVYLSILLWVFHLKSRCP